MDFLAEARELLPVLAELRHEIHSHPEMGNNEYRTAETVENTLRRYGIETRRFLGTAVVGYIGRGGKCAGLRADMDCLPITEETGAAFASRNPGLMHACGHDVHTAALVGAGILLKRHEAELKGSVRLLFQPDEEGTGGADRMVKAGCTEGVSEVFGAHVDPDLPLGKVGIRYGKFYAASDTFTVTVHGKSAHGAEPEKGIDALAAAAEMVTALRKLPQVLAPERAILHIGMLQSGTAGNIIAECAEFRGIIRTLGHESRAKMKAMFRETIEDISRRCGVNTDIALRESYPGVVNTESSARTQHECAAALFGEENVVIINEPGMTTEDFGYFIDDSKGSYCHIGVGGDYPLHNCRFLPADEAIALTAAMHAAAAFASVNK